MSFPAGIAVVYACHPMPFPMPKNISSPAIRMCFAITSARKDTRKTFFNP
jgi:hypothetical protein